MRIETEQFNCSLWNSHLKWPLEKKKIAYYLWHQREQPQHSHVCWEAVHWWRSPTEAIKGGCLDIKGQGNTSAGHWDRNKQGSLVQTWTPGSFGARPPTLRLNRPGPLPKAAFQPIMATTDWALTSSGPDASPTWFHLTITAIYKGETVIIPILQVGRLRLSGCITSSKSYR